MLGESHGKKLSKYSKLQVWRTSGKSVVVLGSPWEKSSRVTGAKPGSVKT